MIDYVSIHREYIERSKAGDKQAEKFLRLRIERFSETMPKDLLHAVSALIIAYRKKELRDEAKRN